MEKVYFLLLMLSSDGVACMSWYYEINCHTFCGRWLSVCDTAVEFRDTITIIIIIINCNWVGTRWQWSFYTLHYICTDYEG